MKRGLTYFLIYVVLLFFLVNAEEVQGAAGEIILTPQEKILLEKATRPYIVGDSNHDGRVDLSDAVFILSYLYQGGSEPTCLPTADFNGDKRVDISDAVKQLQYLFQGGQDRGGGGGNEEPIKIPPEQCLTFGLPYAGAEGVIIDAEFFKDHPLGNIELQAVAVQIAVDMMEAEQLLKELFPEAHVEVGYGLPAHEIPCPGNNCPFIGQHQGDANDPRDDFYFKYRDKDGNLKYLYVVSPGRVYGPDGEIYHGNIYDDPYGPRDPFKLPAPNNHIPIWDKYGPYQDKELGTVIAGGKIPLPAPAVSLGAAGCGAASFVLTQEGTFGPIVAECLSNLIFEGKAVLVNPTSAAFLATVAGALIILGHPDVQGFLMSKIYLIGATASATLPLMMAAQAPNFEQLWVRLQAVRKDLQVKLAGMPPQDQEKYKTLLKLAGALELEYQYLDPAQLNLNAVHQLIEWGTELIKGGQIEAGAEKFVDAAQQVEMVMASVDKSGQLIGIEAGEGTQIIDLQVALGDIKEAARLAENFKADEAIRAAQAGMDVTKEVQVSLQRDLSEIAEGLNKHLDAMEYLDGSLPAERVIDYWERNAEAKKSVEDLIRRMKKDYLKLDYFKREEFREKLDEFFGPDFGEAMRKAAEQEEAMNNLNPLNPEEVDLEDLDDESIDDIRKLEDDLEDGQEGGDAPGPLNIFWQPSQGGGSPGGEDGGDDGNDGGAFDGSSGGVCDDGKKSDEEVARVVISEESAGSAEHAWELVQKYRLQRAKARCKELDGEGFGPCAPRSPACFVCDDEAGCGQTPQFTGCEPTPSITQEFGPITDWYDIGVPPFVVKKRAVFGGVMFTCGCGCAIVETETKSDQGSPA